MIRIESIYKRLEKEYQQTKSDPTVRKPMSKALYNVWKWCDTYEKEQK